MGCKAIFDCTAPAGKYDANSGFKRGEFIEVDAAKFFPDLF